MALEVREDQPAVIRIIPTERSQVDQGLLVDQVAREVQADQEDKILNHVQDIPSLKFHVAVNTPHADRVDPEDQADLEAQVGPEGLVVQEDLAAQEAMILTVIQTDQESGRTTFGQYNSASFKAGY